MNPSFESLARIAEIEFSEIVSDSALMAVESAHFSPDVTAGFRDFMRFVMARLGK